MFAVLGLVLVLWSLCPVHGTRGRELEVKIMRNYSSSIRPAQNKDDKVDVYMTLFIQHIEAVDDRKQTIKVHGAVHTYWYDNRLEWTPSDYNNTDSILVTSWLLWTPDVQVLNSVDGNKQPFYDTRNEALLFSGGYVSLTRDFSFTTSCPLSHRDYPHDRQHCPMVLSSLMYDYSQVDWHYGLMSSHASVIEQRLDWRNQKQHVSGWELINATYKKAYLTRNGIQYEIPTVPKGAVGWFWPMIIAEVELVRHKPYFYLLEVIPMLVTAVLTLTSFWLDAPLLTLAILLSTVVAQGYFSWDLFEMLPPATDGVPKLAVAFAFNFSMTCVAFLVHIILQYLSQQEDVVGMIPPVVSTLVDSMHNSALIGGRGIRLFSTPSSQNDLAKLDPGQEDTKRSQAPLAQNGLGRRVQKIALVAKRVFFWAYVLVYSIFAIAIAVEG